MRCVEAMIGREPTPVSKGRINHFDQDLLLLESLAIQLTKVFRKGFWLLLAKGQEEQWRLLKESIRKNDLGRHYFLLQQGRCEERPRDLQALLW